MTDSLFIQSGQIIPYTHYVEIKTVAFGPYIEYFHSREEAEALVANIRRDGYNRTIGNITEWYPEHQIQQIRLVTIMTPVSGSGTTPAPSGVWYNYQQDCAA